ncbi:MAG: oligoribonuclease, partial [Burkholderiales bacterium]|nr:oligoribonuclease [Burkholderiales bacterium]
TEHHTKSGLVNRVRQSEIDELKAEKIFIDFFSQYVPAGKSPLCGNSIHQDRKFMARWMPGLEQYFHYRNIDVSSFKEVIKRWCPSILSKIQKSPKHVAMSDIYDSIEELRFYRKEVMKI